MKDLFKIYVATKKKDGTVIKSEAIVTRQNNIEQAIESVISTAKELYGYKGKVHICSAYKRNDKKQYEKITITSQA